PAVAEPDAGHRAPTRAATGSGARLSHHRRRRHDAPRGPRDQLLWRVAARHPARRRSSSRGSARGAGRSRTAQPARLCRAAGGADGRRQPGVTGSAARALRHPACSRFSMRKELAKLYTMIDELETAMLTTRRRDGHLVSRAMANQKHAPGADLWFVTTDASGKLDDL